MALTHQWLLGEYWDLIVTLDDANSHILSAFFVEEEGTWSSLQGAGEVIASHGLFCSLYADRGSHYFHTPRAGGRSESLFGDLQGRLLQELALHQITTIDAANDYLKTHFIPAFNERFGVKPEDAESAFVPYLGAPESLKGILCPQTPGEEVTLKRRFISTNMLMAV